MRTKKTWTNLLKKNFASEIAAGPSRRSRRKNRTRHKRKTRRASSYKGSRSKTRPGRLDFRTHKHDKYYNRNRHRQTRSSKGVKGKPY